MTKRKSVKIITFEEICNIISKLKAEEVENLCKYMTLNPTDEQRTRDSKLIDGTYDRVIYEIYEAIKQQPDSREQGAPTKRTE